MFPARQSRYEVVVVTGYVSGKTEQVRGGDYSRLCFRKDRAGMRWWL